MSVTVFIVDGPLPALPSSLDWEGTKRGSNVGAVLWFEGVVRGLEDNRPITALDYEVYQPMAERSLRLLGEAVLAGHGLARVLVWHSRGVVPVGAVSFRLLIEARHRKEALAAMDEFIDTLKRDVPIWKSPRWAD